MTGRTHAAAGCLAALTAVQPVSFTGVLGCLAVGFTFGTLPDIDVASSAASRTIRRLMAAACLAAGFYQGMNVRESAVGAQFAGAVLRQGIPLCLLLFFVFYGTEQPHRGFTHSIAALTAVTTSASMCCVSYCSGIAAAYASHLALDLLNMRGVQLFWPLKGRFCFKLCTADGAVSRALYFVCIGLAALQLLIARI